MDFLALLTPDVMADAFKMMPMMFDMGLRGMMEPDFVRKMEGEHPAHLREIMARILGTYRRAMEREDRKLADILIFMSGGVGTQKGVSPELERLIQAIVSLETASIRLCQSPESEELKEAYEAQTDNIANIFGILTSKAIHDDNELRVRVGQALEYMPLPPANQFPL